MKSLKIKGVVWQNKSEQVFIQDTHKKKKKKSNDMKHVQPCYTCPE